MKFELTKPEERFFQFQTLLTEVQTHFGVQALINRFYWPVIILQEELITLVDIPNGKLVLETIQEGKKDLVYQLSINNETIWEQRQKGKKLYDPVICTRKK